MKKRLFAVTCAALALMGIARASGFISATSFLNEAALAYNKTYAVDLNNPKGDNTGAASAVSFQAVYSSATVPAVTFMDGSPSTASITVSALTHLSSAPATSSLTVAAMAGLLPAAATDTLTVVSTSGLTAAEIRFNGYRLVNGKDFTSTNTVSGTATAIATVLNGMPGIVASASGAVVYATATKTGAAQNSYTLNTSTPSALSVASANFTGGQDNQLLNAVVTFNGRNYRAGQDWKITDTSSGTATNIAAILDVQPEIAAIASGPVVYATATTSGVAGNAFTLKTSTAALSVSSPTFAGGRDPASVSVNGIQLTNGVQWTAGGSNALTAKAISNAIMSNSSLSSVLNSTWTAGGVVSATSTALGSNPFTLVTNVDNLVASAPTFQGGAATSYAIGGGSITIPNHGLTLALDVLYTAAFPIVNLNSGTTYYAIPTDANTVYLASSKTNAVAGTYIILGSSTTTGSHTFTLTPLPLTGVPSFKWEASNDGTNFNDVVVSSITYSSPSSTPTSTLWDFGAVSYRWLRLNVLAPTTGGLHIQVTGNYRRNQ